MVVRIPAELCVRCKGYRKLCGLPSCPIMERFRASFRAATLIKGKEVEGATPPSVIVGESKYPMVPVLYQVPPGVSGEEAKQYDNPVGWWGRLTLRDIISRRSYQVASVVRVNVSDFAKLYETEVSLASVSTKPVDSEAILKKQPVPKLTFKMGLDPVGPSAEAEKIRVVGNAVLPKTLEKLVWDDVKAQEALFRLYIDGVDLYTVIRALSLGLLGKLKNRKLVPTRWAITAVDSTLSKRMLRDLLDKPTINSVEVYRGQYLGNRFTILLYPGRYMSEWIEVWFPSTVFTKQAGTPVIIYNRDNALGKTLSMDGGFDAARFAVIEHLWRRGRKASAVIVREIFPDYYASVGNWHIRETVRAAMSGAPTKFSSLNEALEYVRTLIEEVTYSSLRKLLIRSKYKSLDSFAKD